MRLDSSGRLGLGTSTPSNVFHAQGAQAFASSANSLATSVTKAAARVQGANDASTSIFFGVETSNANPYLQVSNGSGTVSDPLLLQPFGGRVGIGTSTADGTLHVQGSNSGATLEALVLRNNNTASGTAAAIRFTNTTSAYNHASIIGGRVDGGNLDFYTAASANPAVRIDASSRVGIGTTSPSSLLHLSTAGTSYLQIQNTTASNIVYFGNSNGNGVIQVDGANSFNVSINGSERARITSDGKLLVGTSSSSASAAAVFQGFAGSATGQGIIQLQVGKNTAATAVNENLGSVRFANSDGNIGALISGEADLQWNSGDYPSRLVFSTCSDGSASATERMRLNAAGALKASRSGSYVTSITSSIHELTSDQNDIALVVANTNASLSSDLLLVRASRNTSNNSFFPIAYYNAGGTDYRFRVADSGNVTNTNNSYGSISDIKLKENIVDANSQWDDLKALQVRNYNFKEGQTHTQIGLVAQEVELVSPGLVTESPDRDEEGNDLGTVTKSVNYSVLYMKAVKALQEAMERIETLEAKVAALEGV
jgi:hypothetical protein